MITIYSIKELPGMLEEGIKLFWTQWGNSENFHFYHDCIQNTLKQSTDLPQFYLAIKDNTIIGTYALIEYDFTSRQDLSPWFACLYILPEYRGNNYGRLLQKHARESIRKMGYIKLYLCTDLQNYYEKNNWEFLCDAFMISGEKVKIYSSDI